MSVARVRRFLRPVIVLLAFALLTVPGASPASRASPVAVAASIVATALPTPPYVAKTLVLTNGSVVPGNFLAANGGRPTVGCADPTRHVVYAASWGVLTAINATTSAVLGATFVGSNNSAVACDPARDEVFVADADASRVYVVHGSNLSVVASVSVGTRPQAVAVDTGTGEVYVGNNASYNVSVIRETTRTVIATVPLGAPVSGLAYDSGKGEVFASLGPSDNVSVVSDTTHAVVARVHVGSSPRGLAYDAANGTVFVTNEGSGNVSVVSDATNTVVASVALGGQRPVAAVYDAAADQVLVAVSFPPVLDAISAATYTSLYSVYLDSDPTDAQVDAGVGRAFAEVPGWGNVSVLDLVTQRVIATVPVGVYPSAVAYDSAQGKLYVTAGILGTVTVISAATNRILATIPVGGSPRYLAVDPGRGLVFVPAMDQYPYRMYVISDVTDSVVATFPLGYNVFGVAVDPDRGLVFVVDSVGPPTWKNQIEVFNETGFARLAVLTPAPDPLAIAYDAGRGEMLVGAYDSGAYPAVFIIDDANLSVVGHVTVSIETASIFSPMGSLAYDSELGEIFVPDFAANTIHVVSDINRTVVGEVPDVPSPWSLAYAGSGLVVATANPSIFASPFTTGSVLVASDATNTVLANVTVGAVPVGAAYASGVAAIYVVNQGQGTLSILPIPRPYTVMFSESGLPAGTAWSVALGGRGAWTLHPVITFMEPNGSYAYAVGSWVAYLPDPANGVANVSGAAVSVHVTFTALPTPPPPPPQGFVLPLWAAALVVVLAAAGAAAAFALLQRRRRRNPPPEAPPPPPAPP